MFKLNLKIALRSLWNNKGFTLINIGGLAIGIASCMILLLYVKSEWSYDRQFTNYKKSYVVYNNIKASGQIFSVTVTPNAMAEEIKTEIPGVVYTSHSSNWGSQLISYGTKKFKKDVIYADPSFLKILDYKFLMGNPNQVLRDINTVVLTKSLAKNLFGNEDPINKNVLFDNKESLKVEAIVEDMPANSSFTFDYLVPWAFAEKMRPEIKNPNWGDNSYLTLVQLQDESLYTQANRAIQKMYLRHDKNSNSEAFLQPLSKFHLYREFENGKSVGGKIDQLKIFLILAFSILLIACINFMNLTTAKSGKRAKEVGVRKAIGSSRKWLIIQFMSESMLLSSMSTIMAFILVEICLPYFNNILGMSLEIEYGNWTFWLGLFSLMLVTGLLAGSYPSFYLSSFESVKVLKGLTLKSGSSYVVRRVLVIFQFIFAACLIICTTVIYQQLNYIKHKPAGYNRNNLIQIEIQGNLDNQQKLELLKAQLLKSGAATHVTFFNADVNLNSRNTSAVRWTGKNPSESILFNYRSAGKDFLKTMGTTMIAGREFSNQYADSNSIIVNESAVKAMGLKNPIGKTIYFWDSPVKIIGIMKDFISASAYQKVAPMLFHPITRFDAQVILVRLNEARNIGANLSIIDEIVKSMNPDYPVERKFLDQTFEKKFAEEQLLGSLSNWFGGFAIFISCLGLLGLALFMAEQRKKEISIRKVLGATTYSVLALLNKDFIKLVILANIIAFPLGYVIVNNWLSSFDYRVAISALRFILAAGLSLIIALMTVSIQSVKVAKANPVDALRSE
jgi:putative ABC transport system permease protein